MPRCSEADAAHDNARRRQASRTQRGDARAAPRRSVTGRVAAPCPVRVGSAESCGYAPPADRTDDGLRWPHTGRALVYHLRVIVVPRRQFSSTQSRGRSRTPSSPVLPRVAVWFVRSSLVWRGLRLHASAPQSVMRVLTMRRRGLRRHRPQLRLLLCTPPCTPSCGSASPPPGAHGSSRPPCGRRRSS